MDKEKQDEIIASLKQFEKNIEYFSPKFPGIHTLESGGIAYPIILEALQKKEDKIAIVYGKDVDSAMAAGMFKKYAEHINNNVILVPANTSRTTEISRRKFPMGVSLVIVMMDTDTEKMAIVNRRYKPFPVIYISAEGRREDTENASITVCGNLKYTLSSMTTIILRSMNLTDEKWFKREIMTLNAITLLYYHQKKEIYGENEYLLYHGLKVDESLQILDIVITGDFREDIAVIDKYVKRFNRYRGERLFTQLPDKVSEPVTTVYHKKSVKE